MRKRRSVIKFVKERHRYENILKILCRTRDIFGFKLERGARTSMTAFYSRHTYIYFLKYFKVHDKTSIILWAIRSHDMSVSLYATDKLILFCSRNKYQLSSKTL